MEKDKKSQPEITCDCHGCCGSPAAEEPANSKVKYVSEKGWVLGQVETPVGPVPVVATKLGWKDKLAGILVRLGFRRMSFSVRPGLYAVGQPGRDSYIFVSANYKLSFDHLRKNLDGLNAWILVLNTAGINVWCAAGKGTFGTEELIERIRKTRLFRLSPRGTLILPQLGAPGVAAHEVARRTGFKVVYGPVRAADIKQFLGHGLVASEQMRQVRFNLLDRLVLVPVELSLVIKYLFFVLLILLALRPLGVNLLSWKVLYPYLGAILAGSILVPVFLPWIPGRAFSWKGWLVGLLWAWLVNLNQGLLFSSPTNWIRATTNFLLLPGIAAYLALNFTGSSTYTSLSGVVKEMKIAVPLIVVSAILGFGLLVADLSGVW